MKRYKDIILKSVSLPLAALLLIFLVACGGGNSPTTQTDATGNTSSNTDSSSEEETFHLVINFSASATDDKTDPKYHYTEGFKDLVEEKSNGRLTMEIFYSNQLAGQAESFLALSAGSFDMQINSPSAWTSETPEGAWAGLPFWNTSPEQVLHMMHETEIGELYAEALGEYNIIPLAYYPAGSTTYLSNTRLASLEDFKGLVMNETSNVMQDFYRMVDAGSASVPFTDQYEALLRGTIDGVTMPVHLIETYSFFEVIDYVMVPALIDPAINFLSVNRDSWNKLPEDLQQIILDAAREIEAVATELHYEAFENGLRFAEENGVEVVQLTDEEYSEIREAIVETAWTNFASRNERTKRMVELYDTVTMD